MSTKKPDVADSWEEIDEERLPGSISILKNTSNNTTGTSTKVSGRASTSASRLQDTLPQTLEDELRPKMVQRPMQILKRPQSSAGTDGKSPVDNKPKTQIKSLDQRKEEYAKARLRILGSAHDDEETETKKATATTTTSSATGTNGFRIGNVNNNNNSNNNNGIGGNSGVGVGGVGVVGSTANSSANNAYRYHSPYRQQAPIGTFPPSMQNGPPPPPPGAGQSAGMYYPHMGNQSQHHPMHSPHHPLHHPPSAFPHVPHHHHHLQHNGHPYQHQQHFGQHINSAPGTQPMYGGRNGGNVPGGSGFYPPKGGPPPYAEANGGAPLLGHAPPGVHPNHPYGSGAAGGYGQANSHGNLVGHGGANISNNQHVLRLPAGPDGSQGFNVRR